MPWNSQESLEMPTCSWLQAWKSPILICSSIRPPLNLLQSFDYAAVWKLIAFLGLIQLFKSSLDTCSHWGRSICSFNHSQSERCDKKNRERERETVNRSFILGCQHSLLCVSVVPARQRLTVASLVKCQLGSDATCMNDPTLWEKMWFSLLQK